MKTATKIRPGVIFQLARSLEQLPPELKLRNLEWGVLFAVTGKHTTAQLSAHFGLADEERDRVFARLLEAGLIAEREVTFSEYLRASASVRDDEPKSLARFLRAGISLGSPKKPSPAPPAPPKPTSIPKPPEALEPQGVKIPSPAEAAVRVATKDVAETLTRPIRVPFRADPDFQPLADPVPFEAGSPEPEPKLSLRNLMKFILDRAPDRNAGQLDVYRVFMRVNSKLLKRNGITTLRFEDDRIVSDPELRHAITSSFERTLGLSCPKEAFV